MANQLPSSRSSSHRSPSSSVVSESAGAHVVKICSYLLLWKPIDAPQEPLVRSKIFTISPLTFSFVVCGCEPVPTWCRLHFTLCPVNSTRLCRSPDTVTVVRVYTIVLTTASFKVVEIVPELPGRLISF